jgi:hypothetical protein
VAAVADQLVGFDEGAFVEQEIDAFPRGEFAFRVLAVDALRRRRLRRWDSSPEGAWTLDRSARIQRLAARTQKSRASRP